MKAVQLVSIGTVSRRELPTPDPGPHEVLVKVGACGLCETDLHIYRRGLHGGGSLPRTLGHEISGLVEATGTGVEGLAPGDHVVVEPCVVCGKCRFCRAGRPNLCEHLNHLGMNSDGGFAEYVVVPARNAHRVPADIAHPVGALAEPFGCALHGLKRARLVPGEDVVIIGDGFFGLVYTQLARALGATQVAVLGLDESRIARVREQGADYALDGRSAEVKDVAHSLGAGNGPDVVVDTVGTYGSLAQAIELAGVGGRVGLFGGGDREVTVPSGAILGKELDVLGLLSRSDTWGEVVDLLSSGKLHPERTISDVMPLDALEEAFHKKASRASNVVKLVITP